ncbi:hypothetical protein VOLCADRAFT_120532 [Volvox carteri f. nagariensis]|uniref:Uncharacterized protein n=1 Tax=Volvox carteri f. nagariensis TaxID=3068 RepID=D8TNP0_VOLCA|nr:uncharacterized protein VOLCADRAFT_120532 [Volvox carteri f. nagariensis]EFJ51027.1 hypothetical protein VOLCADRAFT_120532 [Volvox carteri f. nagariensis]|eukprot:XP_002948039.1 hypothetical protein VOLCADRAFT_120532 [Volvox carteri f. nagariensis]
MAEVPKGYISIVVEEATGKTQRDQFTWDTNAGAFEAFVKGKLTGQLRDRLARLAQTRKAPLIGDTITWREELRMELLEGSSELRLMLCREKFQGNKRGTSVVAACGIYVNDILEAVPIDKYFELFKPNAGGEGGYIRIRMNFVKDLAELDNTRPDGCLQPNVAFGQQPPNTKDAVGRLTGVVSPETVDEVAKRVTTMGTEPEAPGPVKSTVVGGKKNFILPLVLVAVAGIAAPLIAKEIKAKKDRRK